ncbi:hypothetical protein [Virgibacillus halodenitrificans]|uniref:hypothetical protein n=1 Tax=Virgibacillus halodenitrificans TaxID=1482 RepID=UPI00167A5BF2|nr:hypothetical protein [Virgibacillus halodenitrificans]
MKISNHFPPSINFTMVNVFYRSRIIFTCTLTNLPTSAAFFAPATSSSGFNSLNGVGSRRNPDKSRSIIAA